MDKGEWIMPIDWSEIINSPLRILNSRTVGVLRAGAARFIFCS
jgi:hypothetical protein